MRYLLIAIFILCSAANVSYAQRFRMFSYQALITDSVSRLPVADGDHVLIVDYYDSAFGGSKVAAETFLDVPFHQGIIDLTLGSRFVPSPGFPAEVRFDRQYWIQITVDPGGTTQTVLPRQMLPASAYALNAEKASGLRVATFPEDSTIFPLLLKNGKIDPRLLPATSEATDQINSVGPDSNGVLLLESDPSIQFSSSFTQHAITVSKFNSFDTIVPEVGLAGSDDIFRPKLYTYFVGSGQIVNQFISNGAIDGSKVAAGLDGKAILDGSVTPSKWAPNTGATMLAVGTTLQRPANPIAGTLRFNTTSGKFEGFDGTNWVNLN